MKSLALILPAVLLLASAAQAQPSAQTCPGAAAGWENTLPSATNPAALDGARLTLDQGVELTLHPIAQVTFVTAPERAPRDFGGLVTVMVRDAGTYKIGLSSGAWIDVLKDGKAVTSSAHGHGPACVRKMVSFPLAPGAHVIQLSGNKESTLRLIVSR